MSAAATAAGYLYASGRLRGRGAREQEEHARPARERKRDAQPKDSAQEIIVAALPEREDARADTPKRAPRVQYRVRRWRPEPGGGE